MPLILAQVAAAARLRVDRRLHPVATLRRQVVLGRPEALAAAGPALANLEVLPLPDEGPAHPIRDLEAAHHLVDELRGELEVRAGHAYRARHPEAWLVVDGSLAESSAWAADPRMLGVAKSHATLPFEGDTLVRYLHLPAGHRTSLFRPASRRHAPVHAWGLRLWAWEGRDLFHGLVRVEAAPTSDTLARADEFSRWLLAERSPVSAPDPRWDRLLYGVRGVEMGLRAGAGVAE